MDSNSSASSFQEYLEKEKELQILQNTLKSMELKFNENNKHISDLKSKQESDIEKLEMTKAVFKFYEDKCNDLTSKIEDVYWRQIKANTVLQTEKEFIEKYETKIEDSTLCNEAIETPSMEAKLREITEEKDDLEEKVVFNKKTIEKLNIEFQLLKEECMLLKSNIK